MVHLTRSKVISSVNSCEHIHLYSTSSSVEFVKFTQNITKIKLKSSRICVNDQKISLCLIYLPENPINPKKIYHYRDLHKPSTGLKKNKKLTQAGLGPKAKMPGIVVLAINRAGPA